MPNQYLVEFTERAQSAYDRLPKTAQLRIDVILEQIQQLGLRPPHVKIVSSQERVYLSSVTGQIRLIMQVQDEIITVLDIVSHAQLKRLLRYWY